MNAGQPDEETSRDASQRLATAFHEAGHAVMAFILGRQVHKITIAPSHMAAGGMRLGACAIQKGRSKNSRDVHEDQILFLLAGMVAEAQLTDRYCHAGAAQDLMFARRLLQRQPGSERQLERMERRLLDKAEYLLGEPAHALAIQQIAAELMVRTTISGRAARHLFEQAIRQTES